MKNGVSPVSTFIESGDTRFAHAGVVLQAEITSTVEFMKACEQLSLLNRLRCPFC